MTVSEPLVQAGLLGEAVDRAPVCVFVADEDGRYIAVNQYACDLLGYTREELLELRVTEVATYPEAEQEFAEMVAHRARSGVSELTRKDGAAIRFLYRAAETRVAGMTLYVAIGWPVTS